VPCASPSDDYASDDYAVVSRAATSETGDALLLTPGPLTTSRATKEAMLHDYGSRDPTFIAVTAKVRKQITRVLEGDETASAEFTCVPLQGSGTYAVEAMLTQFVPRDATCLVLANGAYGTRMGKICAAHGRACIVRESAEDAPYDYSGLAEHLAAHPEVTHVALVQCETTTGVLNDVPAIAAVVAAAGRKLLLDAMSAFGVIPLDPRSTPFEAVAASSNKALEGSPGLAFVIARKEALEASKGNADTTVLDLYDQWRGFESNGQWRFTPPTHCVLALAQALDDFEAAGGVDGRRTRYAANCAALVGGMRELGFVTLLPDSVQAPVIVTFRMPAAPQFDFEAFYNCLSDRGYIIYPGKLTAAPSFRVGCIGALTALDMLGFLRAVAEAMAEMGVSSGAP